MSPFWKEDEQGYNICENEKKYHSDPRDPPLALAREGSRLGGWVECIDENHRTHFSMFSEKSIFMSEQRDQDVRPSVGR